MQTDFWKQIKAIKRQKPCEREKVVNDKQNFIWQDLFSMFESHVQRKQIKMRFFKSDVRPTEQSGWT